MASLDIKLKKINKIYQEGEKIVGCIVVDGRGEVAHNGISLVIEGTVNMQLSAKSVGLFEAFYNSVKPISLLSSTVEVAKPGKLPTGQTELQFEFLLKSAKGKPLYETYHGVFISIQYSLKAEMKRPLLNKDLQKSCEFIIEQQPQSKSEPSKRVEFSISPDSISINKKDNQVPNFLVKGHLDSVVCNIIKPFTGEVYVQHSDQPVKSIEIQLVRVETCGCAEGFAKDATEIQNLQIADGDVCRNLKIPIYMVFPRLFTCPTMETPNFKIEFEANVVVVFNNDHLVTENFPIRIYRST